MHSANEIFNTGCLFPKNRCCFNSLKTLAMTALNGICLDEDLVYFTDKLSANYERFVSCKQHDLKYVHDSVLITSNEANELNLLSQKSVQDVKKQIFALLEKLAEHKQSSYKELYDKEVSLQSSLQQCTKFYFFLCEVVDMQD